MGGAILAGAAAGAALCLLLAAGLAVQTLRLDAARTELKTCAEALTAARAARETEEKAHEAYDQNRGLAEPDAARRSLRDGSFLLGAPPAGP